MALNGVICGVSACLGLPPGAIVGLGQGPKSVMVDRKKPMPENDETAIAKLVRVLSNGIADDVETVRREEEEAKRYVEERRESIRKGARRARRSFRF